MGFVASTYRHYTLSRMDFSKYAITLDTHMEGEVRGVEDNLDLMIQIEKFIISRGLMHSDSILDLIEALAEEIEE